MLVASPPHAKIQKAILLGIFLTTRDVPVAYACAGWGFVMWLFMGIFDESQKFRAKSVSEMCPRGLSRITEGIDTISSIIYIICGRTHEKLRADAVMDLLTAEHAAPELLKEIIRQSNGTGLPFILTISKQPFRSF